MSIIWIISGGKQSTPTFYQEYVLQGNNVNDAPNNEQEVVTNTNGLRSSSNQQKRKWRNQWTLLDPSAYVTKSLLGDDSTFFSILNDESTDRTLEKHLIIYVLYLSEGGKGEPHCKFVWLLPMENVKGEGIYNSMNEFILESNLDLKQLVYRYISCLCFGLININTIFIWCISLSLWGSYVYLSIFMYFL